MSKKATTDREHYAWLMRVMRDRFRARPRLYWMRNGGPYYTGLAFLADYARARDQIRAQVKALRILKMSGYGQQ